MCWASQVALKVKNLSANAGDIRDVGSVPGVERSPGGGHGNPLQYSCLENPRDAGARWAAVYGVAQSPTRLKRVSSSSSSSKVFGHHNLWEIHREHSFGPSPWGVKNIRIKEFLLLFVKCVKSFQGSSSWTDAQTIVAVLTINKHIFESESNLYVVYNHCVRRYFHQITRINVVML